MDSSSIFSVAQALKEVQVDGAILKAITDEEINWNMFGKKDSHLHRAKLFKMFRDKKATPHTIFMIFFLFSVIKNKARVLESIDNLPESVKTMKALLDAKEFIKDNIVQYTSQESSKTFAAVHLPTTMPGLDLLVTAIAMMNLADVVTNYIIPKQTFAQIKINGALQEENKAAQRNFWDNVVRSSKNTARQAKTVTDELKFHEDYYNTSATDTYLLIDLDMKEVEPKDSKAGYTKDEIQTWFNNIKKTAESKMKPTGKQVAK
jgi:hypothetical protein